MRFKLVAAALLLSVLFLMAPPAGAFIGDYCTYRYSVWEIVNGNGEHISWDVEFEGMSCMDVSTGTTNYYDPEPGLGGGVGGGGSEGAVWISALGVPVGSKVEVNVSGKQVRTDLVNCQSDFSSLGQAATYYTSLVITSNFAVGNPKDGPFVTLITPNGRQEFFRFTNKGSIQFQPKADSTCGGEGWSP